MNIFGDRTEERLRLDASSLVLAESGSHGPKLSSGFRGNHGNGWARGPLVVVVFLVRAPTIGRTRPFPLVLRLDGAPRSAFSWDSGVSGEANALFSFALKI